MIERLKEDMLKLSEFGRQETGGISRPSFSEPDVEARKYVIKKFKEAGLEVHVDAAGNIFGIREGEFESPVVTTGSHIDTVMNGGMFDGSLGVIGGLEAIRMLNEKAVRTKLPIALVVFTDEEGAFSQLTGSSYFAGYLKKEEMYGLKSKYSGEEFAKGFERIPKEGYVDKFQREIRAHIELHVEQGPILEANNKEIGVVTGIVAVRWLSITFTGRQSHAGTTPMDLRHDPVVPAAKTILKVRELALKNKGTVGTSGYVRVFPNVVNVIAGEATVSADMRSLDEKGLDKIVSRLLLSAKKYAMNEGVSMSYSVLQHKSSVVFPEGMVKLVESCVNELGFSYMLLPSRAGHDTQNVARLCANTSMIFVPSKNGISHSPEEWTDWEQAHKGVEVLSSALARMAQA